MKRIKVILFVFSLLMFMPDIANAECDHNEKSRLQTLASNLNFTYNYSETNQGNMFDELKFSITIANMQSEFYIVDQTNKQIFYYNNKNEIVISNYNPNSTIEFIVYASSGSCKGEHLITNYVTLPPYNPFYKDSVCEGVTDYKLCNRWILVDLSYDDFIEKVKKYKEQTKQEEIPDEVPEDELIEKIIIFLSKYSFYLFGGIIVVCSGLIIYLSRKDDFDLN